MGICMKHEWRKLYVVIVNGMWHRDTNKLPDQ